MIKSLIPASAVLLCSAFAFAAGGGAGVGGAAGAAGGGHLAGASHRGSSFGNPLLENNAFPDARRRPPCIGAVAGVPTSGAPWPIAPATTNPSLTNGLEQWDRAEQPGPPSSDSAGSGNSRRDQTG